ncbi:MAG: histidine phosphatase family protein [Alphaproteobacteria bacterium]|nr:histidine phosphatase family protein [Rhodospirillaceae bacterium]MBT6512143.1 histidine phosphatase family protein [Rhodospirillaceae bacterium]MBT7613572.1 histidine phosphatase family protein [Rhodospirillaceae bacterium]MBT7646418.1 histidine phosphatase family protein [Rhodospirillaceae bacterium]MDG2480937.1 histidine phosphatase family protein [Alphaproteobacteria bacterium]
MPTTLYLLRHAKSSWVAPLSEDHDRDLSDKGRARAAALAEWMEGRALECDLVLCSTALRARQTLEIVLPVLGLPQVRHETGIYEANAGSIIEMLKTLDDQTERVMVVGHEPSLRQTATTLAMTANGDALERLKRKYPTSALSMLTFGAARWSSLVPGMGHLELFYVPPDPDAV